MYEEKSLRFKWQMSQFSVTLKDIVICPDKIVIHCILNLHMYLFTMHSIYCVKHFELKLKNNVI